MQYPSALPTGSGVFGYQLGLSFVKTTDPVIFFGGANVFVQGSRSFNDISTSPLQVQPGTAYPGNALSIQFGTAFALNERTSLSFSFSDTLTNDLRLRPDGGAPTQTVVGSGTSAAVLGIGTSSAVNNRTSIITQLGVGLTKDAPNFQFGIRVPRRF